MKLCPRISSTLLLALASVLMDLVVASDDATFSHNLEKGKKAEKTHDVRMLSNSNRPCRTINANGNGKAGKDKPCTDVEKTRRRPAKYIVGGTPVDSDSKYREAIGLVQVARTDSAGNPTSVYAEPFCSGTLISDAVVLTAAHCVKGRSTMSPDEVAIYFGRDVDDDIENDKYWDNLAAVEEVLPHPNYRRNRFSNDIALIRLRDKRTDETPVPALPSTMGLTRSDIGIELFFVGFGVGGANGGSSTVTKQYVGGIELSSFTSDPGIRYSQGNGGPCSGDSGGGTYVNKGGTMHNAGVVAYGDSSCTSYGVSTQTDKFYLWISDFIGTSTPPGPPTPPTAAPTDNIFTSKCGSCGGSKSSGARCRHSRQCCSCSCAKSGNSKFGTCA